MSHSNTPSCSIYTAKSVETTYIPAQHWRSAKRGDLAYRGQSSSVWLLVPKASAPASYSDTTQMHHCHLKLASFLKYEPNFTQFTGL